MQTPSVAGAVHGYLQCASVTADSHFSLHSSPLLREGGIAQMVAFWVWLASSTNAGSASQYSKGLFSP